MEALKQAQGLIIMDGAEAVTLRADTRKVTFTALPGAQGPYHVTFGESEFVVLVAGAKYGTPTARFEHRNLMARTATVHEFKHYHKGGGKSWTSSAGVDLYFLIPKTAITLQPVHGYSYPEVTINGQTIKLNVSGGTLDGWTDTVGETAHTSVGHPQKVLRAIADVAVLPEGAAVNVDGLAADRLERFVGCVAETDLRPLLAPEMQVYLSTGYTHMGSEGPFTLAEKIKRHWTCREGVRVDDRVIDWFRTAQANNLPLKALDGMQFNRLGAVVQD